MDDPALEQSPEEKLANFLELEDEPNEVEDEEEQEQERESQDPPEQRKLVLKREDGDVEITEEEALELARKGFDYTQKTQAVADQRRELDDRAQVLKNHEQMFQQQAQFQQQFIKDFSKVEALKDQIAQFNGLDWNALWDSDPVSAGKLSAQHSQLQQNLQTAVGELSAKQQQYQQQAQMQAQQRLQEGMRELTKAIPDWSQEKAAQVRATGMEYGFSDQELSGVSDPRMVQVLHDAMQFRALKSKQADALNKVSDKPPVVKPGGKSQAAAAKNRNIEARTQLRKSGKVQDAAAIIERML